jgi:hypothetical protein
MAANISNYLLSQLNNGFAASNFSVVYAATIDPIVYGPGTPLLVSPATAWGGFGYNVFESNGLKFLRRRFALPCFALPGVVNLDRTQFDNHASIGVDQAVLDAVELDLEDTYGLLSGL